MLYVWVDRDGIPRVSTRLADLELLALDAFDAEEANWSHQNDEVLMMLPGDEKRRTTIWKRML